jgi:nucleoid DNA-binding protein
MRLIHDNVVKLIAEETNLPIKVVDNIVKQSYKHLRDGIASEEDINIRAKYLGIFYVNHKRREIIEKKAKEKFKREGRVNSRYYTNLYKDEDIHTTE